MSTDKTVPPLRSSQPAVDIPGFFDATAQAFALHLKTVGPPDDNMKPAFVHEFPKERLARTDDKLDLVTFRVLDAVMAPTLNDGSTPRGPKLRESKTHDKMHGFSIQVVGWWELVQAEFSIWSKSSRNADTVANWFHQFMMRYAHVYKFFQARGVQNFRFVKRADDDVDHNWGQEIYRRRLIYEFRLETLFAFEQKQLTDLDINYGVKGPNDSIVLKPTQ